MKAPYLVCCESTTKAVPYVEALKAVGVDSNRIRVATPGDGPEGAVESAAESAAKAAGVLLCGGPDVDPARYGEQLIAAANLHVEPELDELEWELLEAARKARTPVWGLCRGLQTLNVFLGGSLWQDIDLQHTDKLDHCVETAPDALAHTIEAIAGHEAADAFAGAQVRVNSRHHQALKGLAPELLPLAFADDGIVELAVVEWDGWWARGVQWHPENLLALPEQRQIWLEFVEAADG